MGWTVRRATESDAEAIKAVAVAALRDTYADLLASATIEAFLAGPYELGNVRRRIANDDLQVATDGDRIVAYADAIPEPERVILAAIYALPDQRGQGAGTALLEAIVDRHPGLKIEAEVLLGNRKGEIFYERRGFVPVEALDADLFGERVVERRWRRPAVPPSNRVRLQEPGDAETVIDVRLRSFVDAYRDLVPGTFATELLASAAARASALRTDLEGDQGERRQWRVERGGSIVGMAITNPARDPDAPDGAAELRALYVAPEAQGTGAGTALLARCVDDLKVRGFTRATLWVAAENAARSFYEGRGWLPDGAAQIVEERGSRFHLVRYWFDLSV